MNNSLEIQVQSSFLLKHIRKKKPNKSKNLQILAFRNSAYE